MEVVVINDWGDKRVFDSRKDVDAFFMKEAEALMDRCRRRRRGMAREVVESCKDSIERSLARVKNYYKVKIQQDIKHYEESDLIFHTPIVESYCRIVINDSKLWFCMTDVGKVLGFKKKYDSTQFLCEKENMKKLFAPSLQSRSCARYLWFCNEKGLRSILRTKIRKEDEDKFIRGLLINKDVSDLIIKKSV